MWLAIGNIFVDKIVCNNDQQAPIFLREKLKVGTVEQKYEIIEAIVAQAYPLMVNRLGNFLVQTRLLKDPNIILLDQARRSAMRSQTEVRGRIRFSSPAKRQCCWFELPAAFEIPYSEILTTNLAGPKEVAIEFPLPLTLNIEYAPARLPSKHLIQRCQDQPCWKNRNGCLGH